MRIAVDGVVIAEGQLLLILYHDQQRGLHYGLPGGGVEPNETIRAAVRRELYEETGVQVDIGALLLVTEHRPADDPAQGGVGHELRLLFRCALRSDAESGEPTVPDPDQIGICWLPLDQVATTAFAPHNGALLLELLANPAAYDVFLATGF
ncbi:MAG TPA: NUDIX domain-containing protein [Caldilineaceae bacterium]|nr:NUDIX domain-containing protein [Caldilineaceae bacterium]